MSFYPEGSEVVYQTDAITVIDALGRLMMYWSDTIDGDEGERFAEITGGMKAFQSRYKGDYNKWFLDVQKRELKTMKSYRRQADDLIRMARDIQRRHDFTEEQFHSKF